MIRKFPLCSDEGTSEAALVLPRRTKRGLRFNRLLDGACVVTLCLAAAAGVLLVVGRAGPAACPLPKLALRVPTRPQTSFASPIGLRAAIADRPVAAATVTP